MNAFAADAEAEASGLFAGLDDYGEPAVEGVHLRFMEDIQAGRIAVRSSTEAAGTAHFETKQGRIHRAQISIPVHNGHSYIRQVFPVRGQTGTGGFQKDMMYKYMLTSTTSACHLPHKGLPVWDVCASGCLKE